MKLGEIHLCHHLHSLPFLFLFYFNGVHGQPEAEPQYLKLGPELSRPIAIVIVVLVFIFFIMVFFSVYLRHYLELNATSNAVLRAAGVERFGMCHGLDPAVIRTFPVVAHSVIKEMKIGKWSLECAVCLSEFQDYETLRLLPKCGHVFHPSCIDAWLASCATCPICRAKLAAGGENSASEFVTISVVDETDRNGDRDSEVVETSSGMELSSIGGGGIAGGDDMADN